MSKIPDLLKEIEEKEADLKRITTEIISKKREIDHETYKLMYEAAKCYELSNLLEIFNTDFQTSRTKKALLEKAVLEALGNNEDSRWILLKIRMCSQKETCTCLQCGEDLTEGILLKAFNKEFVEGFRKAGVFCGVGGRVSIRKDTGIFCSSECKNAHEASENESEKAIEEKRKEREQKDLESQKEIEYLKTMPYGEYLETEHWKNLRKSVYKRSRYRCELCNNQSKLNVHHKTYERRGAEYLSDLIALCEDCHRHHHKIKEDDF